MEVNDGAPDEWRETVDVGPKQRRQTPMDRLHAKRPKAKVRKNAARRPQRYAQGPQTMDPFADSDPDPENDPDSESESESEAETTKKTTQGTDPEPEPGGGDRLLKMFRKYRNGRVIKLAKARPSLYHQNPGTHGKRWYPF